jgi:hypothetical protein
MAQGKVELITCGDLELTRGDVRVELEWIGEGWCGDYDAEDPDDDPLLRFSVYGRQKALPEDSGLEVLRDEDAEWVPFADASYCTQLPATLPEAEQRKALEYLMDEVYAPASAGHPIKKLCEGLSWTSPETIEPQPAKSE